MMLKGCWLEEEDSRPADVFKCFLKSHQRSGPLNDNIDYPHTYCHDSADDEVDRLDFEVPSSSQEYQIQTEM